MLPDNMESIGEMLVVKGKAYVKCTDKTRADYYTMLTGARGRRGMGPSCPSMIIAVPSESFGDDVDDRQTGRPTVGQRLFCLIRARDWGGEKVPITDRPTHQPQPTTEDDRQE